MAKLQKGSLVSYTGAKRKRLRRQYLAWRAENNLPNRCDNPECMLHTNKILWNGKWLPLSVNHANGISSDDRPKNLRLLCPNCDFQVKATQRKIRAAQKKRVFKSGGGKRAKTTRVYSRAGPNLR